VARQALTAPARCNPALTAETILPVAVTAQEVGLLQTAQREQMAVAEVAAGLPPEAVTPGTVARGRSLIQPTGAAEAGAGAVKIIPVLVVRVATMAEPEAAAAVKAQAPGAQARRV